MKLILQPFFSLLFRFQSFFSVVILSVRGRLVRKFMLAAHDLGMTRGDYIFLDVEIFQVRETMMMTKNSTQFPIGM